MEAKINIMFLNHVAGVGGAEKGMLDIIRNVDRRRFEFVAVVPAKGDLSAALEAEGVRVFTQPFLMFRKTPNPFVLAGYCLSVARLVPALARLAHENRVDIIHSNSIKAHIYGGKAARRCGLPSIMHARDLVSLGFLGGMLCRSATKIACISASVRKHMAGYCGDAGKVMTVVNGIDTDFFSPKPADGGLRRALNVPGGSILVANIGQLVPWKNQDVFIRAAAQIKKAVPEAFFLVVGDARFGGDTLRKAELENLAKEQGLDSYMAFVGQRSDVREILAETDVLVHAAVREPFGRAVAEAMAMERAVVAVNACGPAELIRNGMDGVLVDGAAPEAIAAAAIELCRNADKRLSLGKAARKRIIESFNVRQMAGEMERLYAEVVNGR